MSVTVLKEKMIVKLLSSITAAPPPPQRGKVIPVKEVSNAFQQSG